MSRRKESSVDFDLFGMDTKPKHRKIVPAAASGMAVGPSGPAMMGPSGPAMMGPSGPAMMGPSGPAMMGPSGPAMMGTPAKKRCARKTCRKPAPAAPQATQKTAPAPTTSPRKYRAFDDETYRSLF